MHAIEIVHPRQWRLTIEEANVEDKHIWENTVRKILRDAAVMGRDHTLSASIKLTDGRTISTTEEELDKYDIKEKHKTTPKPPEGYEKMMVDIGDTTYKYLRYACIIMHKAVPGLGLDTIGDLIQLHTTNTLRQLHKKILDEDMLKDSPDRKGE